MTAQLDASEATWINALPARWPRARNKELLAESVALSQAGAEELLSVSHLTGITPKSEKRVTMIEAESLDGYRLVEPGDLVINMMWAWMGALGVSRYAGIVSPAYSVYRRRQGVEVDSRYFDYLYRSDPYVVEMTRHSRGIHSSRLRLYPNVFLSLLVPNPPLDEQRAIADYLDRETARIDELIEEQQRLIELLRERRQAVIESTVATESAQTSGQRLKNLVLEVRQGWSPQCYPWPADGITTWGVLKAGAVNGGVFRLEENKELPPTETPRQNAVVQRGQLVISRANTRELAGSAAVVNGNYPRLMLCDKLYGFSLDPNRAVPEYVASILGTRRWRGLIELEASGSSPSMQNISQADILNLPMDLPSVEQQRRIAAYLDEQTAKIDTLIAETETFIELARERRSALITAAVTGQIDVRDGAA